MGLAFILEVSVTLTKRMLPDSGREDVAMVPPNIIIVVIYLPKILQPM